MIPLIELAVAQAGERRVGRQFVERAPVKLVGVQSGQRAAADLTDHPQHARAPIVGKAGGVHGNALGRRWFQHSVANRVMPVEHRAADIERERSE